MATAFNGATAAFKRADKQGGLRCVCACICDACVFVFVQALALTYAFAVGQLSFCEYSQHVFYELW